MYVYVNTFKQLHIHRICYNYNIGDVPLTKRDSRDLKATNM